MFSNFYIVYNENKWFINNRIVSELKLWVIERDIIYWNDFCFFVSEIFCWILLCKKNRELFSGANK